MRYRYIDIYEVWQEKVQPLLLWEGYAWHWSNLAAKESGQECVNKDDFTLLYGCHIQNDWASRATNPRQILR